MLIFDQKKGLVKKKSTCVTIFDIFSRRTDGVACSCNMQLSAHQTSITTVAAVRSYVTYMIAGKQIER